MSSRWTRTIIEAAGFAVKDEVISMLRTKSMAEVLDYCMEKVQSEVEGDQKPEHDAFRVYYAIAGIVLVTSRPSQAEVLVPKLDKFVKGLLNVYSVKPRKSALSHMYQHLGLAKAYYYSQKGEIGRAILESSIGFAMSKNTMRTTVPLIGLSHANIVLQKGFALEAAKIFAEVRQNPEWTFDTQLGFIGELRCLRISGQYEAARQLLVAFQDRKLDILEPYRQFDAACLEIPVRGIQALEEYASKGSMLDKGIYAMNKLWLLARLGLIKDYGIKAMHLRQAFNKMLIKDLRFRYGTEVIEEFEKLLDTDVPFDRRLIQAQELYELLPKVDVETRLMTLAALSRWYERNDQRHMAFVMGEEYRSLCLRVSGGRQDNFLAPYGYRGLKEEASLAAVNEWIDRRVAQ
jgi:hypothetical protein